MVTGDEVGQLVGRARAEVVRRPDSITSYAVWCAFEELHAYWAEGILPRQEAELIDQTVGEAVRRLDIVLGSESPDETRALRALLAGLATLR